MTDDIESLLSSVRDRWVALANAPVYRESLRLHLQSLATDQNAGEVEVKNIEFPPQLAIAFAVCKCGVREFIVDGSTQECQHCGGLMFRTEVASYRLARTGHTF
jgi:hypothetical protein